MKTISIFSSIVFLFILNACNFSKGAHKDFSTGLSYSYSGLSVEKVYLTKNNRNKIEKAEAEKFSSLFIRAEGLGMFTEKDGKIRMGANLMIKDEKGMVVLSSEDLFEGNDLFDANTDLVTLDAYLGTNFKIGKQYSLTSKIWDKEDPDKRINIAFSFQIVEPKNKAKIDVEAKNITYSDMVILDNNKNCVSNTLERNKRYYLIITDLKGFEKANNRIKINEKYIFKDLKNIPLYQGEAVAQNLEGQEITSEKNANPFIFPFILKNDVKNPSILMNLVLEDGNNPKNFLNCSAKIVLK